MDNLKRMVIFSHVIDSGSFSAAALRLGIAKSAISKHVTLLEKNIGVRLLNRNTRSLSLTDIGEAYYQSCMKMVEVLEEANQCISGVQDKPKGFLKVSSPASFGIDYIAPLLNEFIQLYPDLSAELLLNDNIVDMTSEGIDVAIRVGWLADSSLKAKKLKDAPRMICASAEYLKRNSIPKTPKELALHEWVIFTLLPTPFQIELKKKSMSKTIQIKGRLRTNNGNAVRRLLLEGAGIAALSDFLVKDDIETGRLIQLLPDYTVMHSSIYAVYHDQQVLQPKIRSFIDFLAEKL